jgi:hypothetical protein
MAPDGTLVLAMGGAAWLRRPVPPGSTSAWRAVPHLGVMQLPYGDGRALMVRFDEQQQALILTMDEGAAHERPIQRASIGPLRATGCDLSDLTMSIDGRMVTVRLCSVPHRRRFVLGSSGQWLPMPAPSSTGD